MLKARRRLKSKILSRLPLELIPDILTRLPIEQLLQMRCCNKGFCQLIDDHYFRKLYDDHRVIHHSSATTTDDHTVVVSFFTLIQLNQEYDCEFHFSEYDDSSDEYKVTQPVTYPPFLDCSGTGNARCIIVGSCNGLVCLADHRRIQFDPIYILNPVTREELKLPPIKVSGVKYANVVNGFGYHPITKEYKVVRIYYSVSIINGQRKVNVGEVEVYTLGTGVWRSIGVPSLFKTISFQFLLSSVLVNGALHWINKTGNIASFDLETEDFHLIPSPSSFQSPVDGVGTWYDLCVLTERLCLSRQINYVRAILDIWALNKDTSWTKEYNIDLEINPLFPSIDYTRSGNSACPITLTKSGKLLLWYNDKILVSYDPKNGERKIHGEYKPDYYNEAVVHVKSFVSLKALGEENAKITRIRNQRLC